MAIAQVFISGWMDRQNGVHTYDGILFILIKKGNSDTYYSTDEPWGPCAKWNNKDTKGQILCDSSSMRYLK